MKICYDTPSLFLEYFSPFKNENDCSHWIICDGPIDYFWMESLNSVLDDNKCLCLTNSERIKLTSQVYMLFETLDLTMASPATVSRYNSLTNLVKYLQFRFIT